MLENKDIITYNGIHAFWDLPCDDMFSFFVDGTTYKCPKIIADFVSPVICKLHQADPSINEFKIDISDQYSMFKLFVELMKGNFIIVNDSNVIFLLIVASKLGNTELVNKINKIHVGDSDITSKNAFFRLSQKKLYGIDAQEEIDFIAEHLYELDINQLLFLDASTVELILNNSKLQIQNEDWLCEIVLGLIRRKGPEFSVLLGFVAFEDVSNKWIEKLMKIPSIEEQIHGAVYHSIKKRSEHRRSKKNARTKDNRSEDRHVPECFNEDEYDIFDQHSDPYYHQFYFARQRNSLFNNNFCDPFNDHDQFNDFHFRPKNPDENLFQFGPPPPKPKPDNSIPKRKPLISDEDAKKIKKALDIQFSGVGPSRIPINFIYKPKDMSKDEKAKTDKERIISKAFDLFESEPFEQPPSFIKKKEEFELYDGQNESFEQEQNIQMHQQDETQAIPIHRVPLIPQSVDREEFESKDTIDNEFETNDEPANEDFEESPEQITPQIDNNDFDIHHEMNHINDFKSSSSDDDDLDPNDYG